MLEIQLQLSILLEFCQRQIWVRKLTLVAPSDSGAVTKGYWHGRVVFQGFDTIYKTDDLELEIDFAE